MTTEALTERRQRAIVCRKEARAQGYSRCHCCGMPWSHTDGHSTTFNRSQGCFPLCKECWNELTPETRLPFYRQLYMEWESLGADLYAGMWSDIETAVLSGK